MSKTKKLATKAQRHKDVYFSWCLGALVAKLYKTGDLARKATHRKKLKKKLKTGKIEFYYS